jgi:hypothetical protein
MLNKSNKVFKSKIGNIYNMDNEFYIELKIKNLINIFKYGKKINFRRRSVLINSKNIEKYS